MNSGLQLDTNAYHIIDITEYMTTLAGSTASHYAVLLT